MKKIHTFESFTNSVSEGKLNMKKMIKAAGKALSKGADNDDLDMFIDDYLEDNGIPFDEFDYDEREELYQGLDIQYGIYIEEKRPVSENKPVDESISFGYKFYQGFYAYRWEYEDMTDFLPAKGETFWLVKAHNEVMLNGEKVKIDEGNGYFTRHIGVYKTEEEAKKVYDKIVKDRPFKAEISFSMGTLHAKTKFAREYNETQGVMGKIKIMR